MLVKNQTKFTTLIVFNFHLHLFKVYGCFYHLCSNVWKHVQECLQVRYMADNELALTVRMIPALAFVPLNDVTTAFDDYGQDIDQLRLF